MLSVNVLFAAGHGRSEPENIGGIFDNSDRIFYIYICWIII